MSGGVESQFISVQVDDIDAHYRRAVAAGARVADELRDQSWGERTYWALDLEGHRWRSASRYVEEEHPAPLRVLLLDQFMIVIAVWVPYLATQGIGMRQFMELQAVFAIVILSGEVPSGLLSDLWGRKKTLLLGAALKASAFLSCRCGAATRAFSSTTSRWGSR
jgi:hypothetical protein